MIECTECGFLNEEDDHFCGGCREPLEWTGRRIEDREEHADEQDPEPTDERGGLVERVLERLGDRHSEEGSEPAELPGEVEPEQEQGEQDPAATVTAETVARVEREVEEAVRAQSEAEQQAQQQATAAEQARARAAEARAARERAEESAREETDEDARREAEERARAEAAAAEEAARAAAAAEEARAAAEAKARKEAEAAAQARRAAALVARPKPEPPDEQEKGRQNKRRQDKERDGEDRTSQASGPGPVEPDRPRRRRSTPKGKQKSSRRLRPGDRICGKCGEGNVPSRNYCRRCGHELQEAEVVRRPWWKRWIPRRGPRAYEAGERPDRSGRSGAGSGGGTGGVKGAVRGAQGLRRRVMGPIGKVARVLAVVVVAAGAAGLAFNPDLRSRVTDPATDAFEWVRQRIAPQVARVNPVAVEATSARADTADGLCCAAENVLDFGNTWWHASEGGVGQFLVLTLDTPTTITDFGVIPGAGDDTIWSDHPRPRDLEVDFLDDEGRTVATADITDVKDEHNSEAQVFDIDGAQDVTRVRVTITRVYGENLDSDDVAISEVRLWTRR